LSTPIIFFHYGTSDYLKYSIKSAKKNNPNSRIILLTNQENHSISLPDGCEKHLLDDYSDGYNKFVDVYEHLSTNDKFYEFICFARWFVIHEFVVRHNIPRFFYADSDVLLFCDIEEEAKKFETCKFTVTNCVSAGITFVNDVDVLKQYCDLCMNVYTRKDMFSYDRVSFHYMLLQKNGRAGGVSDMNLWDIMRRDGMNNPGMVGETSSIINGSTFDHNINQSDGYEMENGMKKITWKKGIPYVKNTWLDKDIRFNCLHMQGSGAKHLMGQFLYKHEAK